MYKEDRNLLIISLNVLIIFLIAFFVCCKTIFLPKYIAAKTEESKYVYIIKCNDQQYIIDSQKNHLQIHGPTLYKNASISFILDDGTEIRSSSYSIKKVLKENIQQEENML